MPKLKNIKGFIRNPHYHVNISWPYLENWLNNAAEDVGLELNPEFQRGHVWIEAQQIAYVEYQLRGGISGKSIFWNCKGHMGNFEGPYLLVDGLQRITAVRKFMANELKVFGRYLNEYDDPQFVRSIDFDWYVHKMDSMAHILKWYIELNEGGVRHTTDEIDRVRGLLAAQQGKN